MTQRKYRFSAAVFALVVVADVGMGRPTTLAFTPDEPGANKGASRTLRFPKARSLGVFFVQDRRIQGGLLDYTREGEHWDKLGQAKGLVPVPAGKKLRLDVSREALKDLSPLLELGANDLYMLTFFRCGSEGPDQSCMRYMSAITGLKVLNLWNTTITDKSLSLIKGMKSLTHLYLPATIGDAGLASVSELQSLEVLGLYLTAVTDAGLSQLSKLGSLRELSLGRTSIKSLSFIKEMKSLEHLGLPGTKISDSDLAHLSHLKAIKYLDLSRTRITEGGLVHLTNMKSLEHLRLPRSIPTDRVISQLVKFPKLKNLAAHKIGEKSLGLLPRFSSLEDLDLSGKAVTDDTLDSVARLTKLKKLGIGSCRVSNAGLAKLASCKSLETISLFNGNPDIDMPITSSGLAHLKAFSSLKYLFLYNIQLDESRLSHLANLKGLEYLDLKTMAITDHDLTSIAKLTRLKRLFFDSRTVSDAGLAHLARLTTLVDLAPSLPMTDVGLSYLANMTNLERLQVSGDFTDEGLRHLEGLKSLRTLQIRSAHEFSSEGLERLRKSLPELTTLRVRKTRKVGRTPEIGTIAPNFALKTINGRSVSLTDYRGKFVLLYFWATWCSPCVASTPALKAFHKEFRRRDKFQMISLSLDTDELRHKRYVEANGLTWPHVRLGLDSEVSANFGVSGVPSYTLIGPDGKVLLNRETGMSKLKEVVESGVKRRRAAVPNGPDANKDASRCQ